MTHPITPFTIHVEDAILHEIKAKLAQATFPQTTSMSEDWDYGTPLAEIKRLARYWESEFDWRKAEVDLNKLPQYTTDIAVDGFDNVNIHFLHQKSEQRGSIPLLFCHGWPGGYHEVIRLLPLLKANSDGPAFHVVAPSLANFGFSGIVSRPGFGPMQHAEVCHKLMLRLGYDKYVTQGGDWGFAITRLMSFRYPEHVLATHINFVRTIKPPSWEHTPGAFLRYTFTPHTEAEKQGLERSKWFDESGFGYNLQQSTRPHTIGFALKDSPVALLAWILEKLHDWTDDYPWTDDEILTWISIYAFSIAGPDASARIYYESRANQEDSERTTSYNSKTPLGVSIFPKDLVVPPDSSAHSLGPVVFLRRHLDGGHFAAHERPEALVEDLRIMFGSRGGAAFVAKHFQG